MVVTICTCNFDIAKFSNSVIAFKIVLSLLLCTELFCRCPGHSVWLESSPALWSWSLWHWQMPTWVICFLGSHSKPVLQLMSRLHSSSAVVGGGWVRTTLVDVCTYVYMSTSTDQMPSTLDAWGCRTSHTHIWRTFFFFCIGSINLNLCPWSWLDCKILQLFSWPQR